LAAEALQTVAGGGPVGVFDSGVGGLSVLREIRALLPGIDLAYVADSAHCPYGARSEAEIRAHACAITRFVVEERGAQAVVVACNTATAAAIDLLRSAFDQVAIVGMEPAIKPAAVATRSGVVGVLATGATLGGERFAGLAARFSDGVELLTQACPGWWSKSKRATYRARPRSASSGSTSSRFWLAVPTRSCWAVRTIRSCARRSRRSWALT